MKCYQDLKSLFEKEPELWLAHHLGQNLENIPHLSRNGPRKTGLFWQLVRLALWLVKRSRIRRFPRVKRNNARLQFRGQAQFSQYCATDSGKPAHLDRMEGWVKARNFKNSNSKLQYACLLTPRYLQARMAEYERLRLEMKRCAGYSKDNERFMNQPNDIRWHQRLQNFQSAFNELDEAVAKLPPAVEKTVGKPGARA